jgi:hypothetical protein
MISYGLLDILEQRAGQRSFHIASEKSIRIEFMRFSQGQKIGPIAVAGDVIVTCLDGVFEAGDQASPMTSMTQVVFAAGERLQVRCTSDEGAIQLIWAPPFPPVTREASA